MALCDTFLMPLLFLISLCSPSLPLSVSPSHCRGLSGDDFFFCLTHWQKLCHYFSRQSWKPRRRPRFRVSSRLVRATIVPSKTSQKPISQTLSLIYRAFHFFSSPPNGRSEELFILNLMPAAGCKQTGDATERARWETGGGLLE